MNDKSVKYIRPLDRSQDKYFEKLAPKNQSAVTELRIALERTKSRIASLKEANIVKDEVIEEEKILRRAAEDRLDNFLVDLYECPEVNSELRERLPYANKKAPMIKPMKTSTLQQLEYIERDKNAEMEINKTILVDETHNNERLDVLTNSYAQGLISSSEATLRSSTRSSGVQTEDAISYATEHHRPVMSSATSFQHAGSPDTQLTNSWVSSDTHSSNSVSFASVPTTSMLSVSTVSAVPYMYPMGPLSSSAGSVASFAALPLPQGSQQEPAPGLNPFASASFASLAASSYVELPNNQKGIEEINSMKSSIVNNQPEMNKSGSVFDTESLVDATSTIQPASSTIGLTMQPLYMTSLPPQSLPPHTPSLYSQRVAPDNVSHISRLLAEIATLKKEKQELEDKLKASEQKREELKLGIGTSDNKTNQDIGALIEEIRAAEKVRDQTVKKVVQTAQEEKERKYKKENNTTKGHNLYKLGSPGELSDTEDDESVTTSQSSQASEVSETKVAQTSNPREDTADVASVPSLQDLTDMMQRQRLIMAQELQKVIDERNDAQRLLLKLENKVIALELRPKPNGKVDELMATLSVVRRERDVAVAKLKALMSEMAETKLVYSLHKALWREDQHNETSSSEPSTKFNNVDQAVSKNNNTISSCNSKHENTNAKLKAQLAFSDQERQLQNQRIKELEHLVKRQRQKLNVMCAGPMMLDGCIETE